MNSFKEPLKLGGILGAIALVISVMLAFVNGITKERIEAVNAKIVQDGLKRALPSEQEIEFILMDGVDLSNQLGIEVKDIYIAVNGEDNVEGYCATVLPYGYGGTVETIVGIDLSGTVKGVVVTENMSETAGLGAKAQDEKEFTYQFKDRTPPFAVKADKGDIDAITSATITSRAITQGVNAAAEVIEKNNIYEEYSKDDIINGKYVVKAEKPQEETPEGESVEGGEQENE